MGLVLTKQQLNAIADGTSLSAALTAENSHQIFLVNQPHAAKVRGGCAGSGGFDVPST